MAAVIDFREEYGITIDGFNATNQQRQKIPLTLISIKS